MVLLLMPWLISSLAEKLWSSSQLSESLMIPLLDNSIKMMIPWVPKTTLIDSEEREEEEDPTQTKWTYISSAFWLEAKNLKRDRERHVACQHKKQLWPIDLVFKHKEQAIKVVSNLNMKTTKNLLFNHQTQISYGCTLWNSSTLESNKGELLFLHTTPFIFFTRLNFLFLYGQLKAWWEYTFWLALKRRPRRSISFGWALSLDMHEWLFSYSFFHGQKK